MFDLICHDKFQQRYPINALTMKIHHMENLHVNLVIDFGLSENGFLIEIH